MVKYKTPGTPEYDELKDELKKGPGIKPALDPMFAPVTYGDDRQVNRTRRGIHCQIENNYNPLLVYCKCLSCNYQWIMDKSRYIQGTGDAKQVPNPTNIKNVGKGGTGILIGNFPKPEKDNNLHYENLPMEISKYFDYDTATGQYYGDRYSKYNVLAHDTSHCKTTNLKCQDGLMHTHDFYVLTGGTGRDGQLLKFVEDLSYDPNDGHLTGNTNSVFIGHMIPIYTECDSDLNITNHPGGSGTYGNTYIDPKTGARIKYPLARTFGGHPMACPNCCKVNFIAKWLEPNDRPNPYGEYKHMDVSDIPSTPVPPPILNDFKTEYIPWVYNNRYIDRFEFEQPSTVWFVENKRIFNKHVAILIFYENGNMMPLDNVEKVSINFKVGSCTIVHKESIGGYFWVLKPQSILNSYVKNINRVCIMYCCKTFFM